MWPWVGHTKEVEAFKGLVGERSKPAYVHVI